MVYHFINFDKRVVFLFDVVVTLFETYHGYYVLCAFFCFSSGPPVAHNRVL